MRARLTLPLDAEPQGDDAAVRQRMLACLDCRRIEVAALIGLTVNSPTGSPTSSGATRSTSSTSADPPEAPSLRLVD